MYIVAFALGILLGRARIRSSKRPIISLREFDDMVFYIVLGVIIGGRIGYSIFYDTTRLLAEPTSIFYVWQGGMSFHGGLAGVCLALMIFARTKGKRWLVLTDFTAPLIPLGLGAGRIGNFINGELWGRPTDASWAMVFPQSGTLVGRHPSQLYEFFFEGVLLFIIVWVVSKKPRPLGTISGIFLVCYGGFRFFIEFVREPDEHMGLLLAGLSMGQLLSLPLLVLGVFLLFRKNERQ